MRFVPLTTPHPTFRDAANNPLQSTQPLSDPQKREFLAWVAENCHDVTGTNLDEQKNNCWNWKGATDKNQGAARYMNYPAHSYIFKRLSNTLHLDPATLGRITRTCGNPLCVNPNHCRISEGPRTKHNRKVQDQVAHPKAEMSTNELIEEITEVVTNNVLKTLTASLTHDLTKTLTQTLTSQLPNLTADAVVAELLRVRFDEIVARAVKGK
jgi:hypothetical protein